MPPTLEPERRGAATEPGANRRCRSLLPDPTAPVRTRAFPVLVLAMSLYGNPPSRAAAPATYRDFELPPHHYFAQTPHDPFTVWAQTAGPAPASPTAGGDLAYLRHLLDALRIPASSQTLVFSTTSLQLSRISPSNPRAIYFNEDTSIGYIPGGRIEVLSIDPQLGAIFHIFDIPRPGQAIRPERSNRCMNCHAGEDSGYIPGLVIKSVAPADFGGSLDTFRPGRLGHDVPLVERFGGWHVTGTGEWTGHWGNVMASLSNGEISRIPNPPGARYDPERYPVATSDILAHLIHEHQAGFINRAIRATYIARTHLFNAAGNLSPAQEGELDAQADLIVRYLLFTDEAPLPPGGFAGDPAFRSDYVRSRREVDGRSLKELDLKTRLFKLRCSPMIHSATFGGLHPVVKKRVYARLATELSHPATGSPGFPLAAEERQLIRKILRGTLPDLPEGW